MFKEIERMEISRQEKVNIKVNFVKKMMTVQMEKGFVNTHKFFLLAGIDKNTLNTFFKRIRETEPEFYNEYCIVMKNYLEKFREDTKENMLTIARMINEGVPLYDGTTREFDLLDCYEIIGRSFEGFSKVQIMPIFEETQKEHCNDFQYNFAMARKNISQCFDQNNSMYRITPEHVLKDDFHNLTIIEKQHIINYFNNNNIPFTTITLYYAVNRCIMEKSGNKKNNYFKTLVLRKKENVEENAVNNL